MGIERFISTVCMQTAVYWGNPQPDGYGGLTFDEPVEVSVRWDTFTEVMTANNGKEFTSRAKILITQDVDPEGYLMLGSLADIDSGDLDDPRNVEGAWWIRRFDKISMIKSTSEFVRIVYV